MHATVTERTLPSCAGRRNSEDTMTKEIFEARREKLRRLMHEEGLDALLISQPANRFYLSGFEKLYQCNGDTQNR